MLPTDIDRTGKTKASSVFRTLVTLVALAVLAALTLYALYDSTPRAPNKALSPPMYRTGEPNLQGQPK